MKSLFLYALAASTCVILGSASGCSNENNTSDAQMAEKKDKGVSTSKKEEPMPVQDLNAKVKISTEFGDMIVELYDETPQHRDNFLKLVEGGFYDELLFHRVIPGFMIQGGDPDSKGASPQTMLGRGGPGYTVPAEFVDTLVHTKGALSAARQGDQVNPRRESSGSQFYVVQGNPVPSSVLMQMERRINMRRDSTNQFQYTNDQIEKYTTLGGTPHLDGDYTVFGQVTEGLAIIDSIAAVETGRGDRPVKDVTMTMERIQ